MYIQRMLMFRRTSRTLAWLWLIGGLLLAVTTHAATYFVAVTGNDANPGTQQSPWRSVRFAAGKVTAGDIVRVQPGTYNERVSVTADGTASSRITFIADGAAIMRGFDLNGSDYVDIIGFEITHNSSTWSRAITLNGTISNVRILNNYIHNTYGDQCVQGMAASTPTYITIRGNYINEVRWVPGVEIYCSRQAIGCPRTSHHWLIEYNHISRSGDFINLYGTDHIVRNNYLHDYRDSYCPVSHSHTHSDMFQPGSDGQVAGSKQHVYERNFMGDSIEANSHVALFQDNQNAGDTNMLMRGNVAFSIGDGFMGGFGTDGIRLYNNTIHDTHLAINGWVVGVWGGSGGSYPSTSNVWKNLLIHNNNGASDAIHTEGASEAIVSHNLGYLTGPEPSYISTSNPLFINPVSGARNFRLQPGSPAINAGTHVVWITSGNGSGTSFNVNCGQLLCDGYGMVEGDVVTINGTTTRITRISGNTVTVANSVTWTNLMPVYWGTDTTPDIGALPYGSVELTAATLSQSGSTYTVTTVGDTRGVWFYADGIPVVWDYEPPYQANISAGRVTAMAHALYAQAISLVAATPTDASRPTPPENLRIE
jgi:hypothetical protein